MYKFIKPVFSFLISLALLPIVLIITLFVGAAIKIEDGGPIFFLDDRIGKNGKIFKMIKFRSMKVGAPDIRLEDGSTYNSEDDPRVTKVGRFLRKTSIDELPQLFNILFGQMAYIGPRPDSAMWIDNYTEEEKVVHNVLPGITGYNQAVNRNAVGTKEKLQNDIYYVEHFSFLFDLKILFLTVGTVLSSKNVYRVESSKDEESTEKTETAV